MATRDQSGTRKTATRKSAPRRSDSQEQDRDRDQDQGQDSGQESREPRRQAPRASAPKRASASRVAAEAARQLLELTGRASEGVTGLERTDDGWTVQVEVVEVRRIPETTDVLALYDIEVDEDGELLGYRRVSRYSRGDTGENER